MACHEMDHNWNTGDEGFVYCATCGTLALLRDDGDVSHGDYMCAEMSLHILEPEAVARFLNTGDELLSVLVEGWGLDNVDSDDSPFGEFYTAREEVTF